MYKKPLADFQVFVDEYNALCDKYGMGIEVGAAGDISLVSHSSPYQTHFRIENYGLPQGDIVDYVPLTWIWRDEE